ncbi:hypothetical protein, partial [Bradyrhizobium sp.]|uniref:hypothetical protein n=1 Tax=Bradyrhizobium sp. TaxID=376 RepID=UPI003C1F6561
SHNQTRLRSALSLISPLHETHPFLFLLLRLLQWPGIVGQDLTLQSMDVVSSRETAKLGCGTDATEIR